MSVLNKDKILDAAREFVSQGKFDRAIREYEKLLQADPADMRVKLRLAELFAKRRQVPQAIQAYREVADSYAHEGFFLKAVTVLKSILRLNPSLFDVNLSLADLYEKMGLNKDAASQYEILASAFEQKGDFAESLRMREKLVALFPKQQNYRVRLAEAYQREDKKEEAIEQFEILAGQVEKEKGEKTRLIDLYEKILPHRPENHGMFAALVDLYHEKKDYRSALKWLEQKKSLVETDAHLLERQAEMYGKLNQLESARGKYQQLASLCAEKGELEKALDCYAEILVLLPEEGPTVRGEVEKLKPGVFEGLAKRAVERRAQREAEDSAREAAKEAQKEAAREVAREKPDSSKPSAQKTSAAPKPSAPKVSAAKVPTGAKAPASAKAPSGAKAPAGAKPARIEDLLRAARASVSLYQAYRSAGLKEEAASEAAHAKEALNTVLNSDPNHAEAKRLLEEVTK